MPIPILIVGSFIGLCIYIAIGSVVSAVFVHQVVPSATVKNYLNRKGAEDALAGYILGTLFWPFLLIVPIFMLPVLIGQKVTRYIAAAQLKEDVPRAA